MSLSVFETLKDLTDGSGRIVLATVHCPSSKTYHLFSRLLLLTVDGRLAYQGPASEALEFLQGVLRWDCPANYNPGWVGKARKERKKGGFLDMVCLCFG